MTYRFGRFSVNSDTRQLLADDREVHLSPKAFELLLTLIQHRSRALSKAELQERLWPATFVGEANLPTLVAEIRRAVDDSAQDSACVQTLHRFGYRFVGSATEEPAPRGKESPGAHMYVTTPHDQFPLSEGEIVIGRAQDAAIRVDSGGVSRHHARIVVSGDEARVEDLGSKNGTFVDGAAVTGTCLLRDGNEIRVGPVTLTFRVAPPTQATVTMS